MFYYYKKIVAIECRDMRINKIEKNKKRRNRNGMNLPPQQNNL